MESLFRFDSALLEPLTLNLASVWDAWLDGQVDEVFRRR